MRMGTCSFNFLFKKLLLYLVLIINKKYLKKIKKIFKIIFLFKFFLLYLVLIINKNYLKKN